MLIKLRHNTNGDTLVEVLLATALLALVLVSAFNLSSRATRLNQISYERTRATNLIQEQVELLKAARSIDDVDLWRQILNVGGSSPYFDCRADVSPNPVDTANYADYNLFYLYSNGTDILLDSTDTGSGTTGVKETDDLFYTFVNRTTADGPFQDFYIYTCWPGFGDQANQVAGAAVRIAR